MSLHVANDQILQLHSEAAIVWKTVPVRIICSYWHWKKNVSCTLAALDLPYATADMSKAIIVFRQWKQLLQVENHLQVYSKITENTGKPAENGDGEQLGPNNV